MKGFIFILFYKAQARIFTYKRTSSMNHESWNRKSFRAITAHGFLQVNNL